MVYTTARLPNVISLLYVLLSEKPTGQYVVQRESLKLSLWSGYNPKAKNNFSCVNQYTMVSFIVEPESQA